MNDPSLKLLGSSDFNPEKYVKELSQNCVGRSELARLRGVIQSLSSDTSANLKRNVFQNYKQFINTAKEISHLESEMYQLSHLLTEQKSLLSALYNTSILGDDTPLVTESDTKGNKEEKDEEIRRQKLTTILEKVEGCIDLLEVPNRILLHEGHITELEPIDNTPLAAVWAILFSDGLMLSSITGSVKRRYKFLAFYDLGSLAVVNVRDLGSVKYAFKLLAFPDTRLFQCTSNQSKREWIDKFDLAKKARLTQDQKRESISEKSPSRSTSIETTTYNPFEENEDDLVLHPDWMLEVAEELDVYIAQRQFENALNLLQKAKEYISQYSAHTNQQQQPDHVFTDIQRKVEQRTATLIEVLMKELEVSPDKSLQGGLRAARRAVRILNLLGRSTQSCHLFLRLCSSMLKTQCKRVKREGSTIMYVRHLSSVVFTNMCHMTEEFLRAFPDSPTCTSAYVVWATGELRLFTSHFVKQVFVPQTSLSTITECVLLVRQQCEKLCSYGIDICYQLDGALRTPLIKALHDTRDKFIDVVRRKSNENRWIPMNLRSKVGLSRFLQEYVDLGLNLDGYITGDYWLQLSTNTLFFTKLFLTLLDDCIKLRYQELSHTIDDVLATVFANHMQYYEQSMANETLETKQFIMKNISFLVNTVLDLAQKKYEDSVHVQSNSLLRLQKSYAPIVKDEAKTRIIPKYSSNEYL